MSWLRGGGVSTLVKGFIVIVDLFPLGLKLSDLLVKSGPSMDVRHNVLECGMVNHIQIWMKDRGNR